MSYTAESGWRATRAAGVLNFYLAGNPEMTYADVINWAAANGLPDWEPTLETTDSALVGTDGKIRWDDRYDYPSNWAQLFTDWKNGYNAAEIPQPPTNINILTSEVAQAAQGVEAVAPAPVPVIVIEPLPYIEPVAIPQPPEPTSYTTPAQVNPAAAAPSQIDYLTPQQVQPALVAPMAPAAAIAAAEVVATPPIFATAATGENGDGMLLKLALAALLI